MKTPAHSFYNNASARWGLPAPNPDPGTPRVTPARFLLQTDAHKAVPPMEAQPVISQPALPGTTPRTCPRRHNPLLRRQVNTPTHRIGLHNCRRVFIFRSPNSTQQPDDTTVNDHPESESIAQISVKSATRKRATATTSLQWPSRSEYSSSPTSWASHPHDIPLSTPAPSIAIICTCVRTPLPQQTNPQGALPALPLYHKT